MHIGPHEYANEADDDDVPKPAQSLGTPVPRQNVFFSIASEQFHMHTASFSIYILNIVSNVLAKGPDYSPGKYLNGCIARNP